MQIAVHFCSPIRTACVARSGLTICMPTWWTVWISTTQVILTQNFRSIMPTTVANWENLRAKPDRSLLVSSSACARKCIVSRPQQTFQKGQRNPEALRSKTRQAWKFPRGPAQNAPKHYCKVLHDQVDEPRGKYCGSHKVMPMCLRWLALHHGRPGCTRWHMGITR